MVRARAAAISYTAEDIGVIMNALVSRISQEHAF